jgi:LysM repeat protein
MTFAMHLAAAAALFFPPDIIPEGARGIRVTLRVDPTALGPFTGRACLQHVVAAGETLESIAREQLGNADRWPEIADLNPGVDPARLAIGRGLWLPPRRAGKAGEEPVLLFAGSAAVSCHFTPLPLSGEVLSAPRWGELSVLVVPLSARKELEAALAIGRDRQAAVEKLARAGKIQLTTAPAPGRLVDRNSPVASCVATYRIAADATAKLRLEQVSVEQFAADGKPLPRQPVGSDGAGSKGGPAPQPEKGSLLLLPIGLLGAGGLLLRSRTRPRVRNA